MVGREYNANSNVQCQIWIRWTKSSPVLKQRRGLCWWVCSHRRVIICTATIGLFHRNSIKGNFMCLNKWHIPVCIRWKDGLYYTERKRKSAASNLFSRCISMHQAPCAVLCSLSCLFQLGKLLFLLVSVKSVSPFSNIVNRQPQSDHDICMIPKALLKPTTSVHSFAVIEGIFI